MFLQLHQLCVQAMYHGFGITVDPAKLSPPAFEPIVEALMLALGDTSYTVRFSEPVCVTPVACPEPLIGAWYQQFDNTKFTWYLERL